MITLNNTMKENEFFLKSLSLKTYSQWKEIKNENLFKKSFFYLASISLIFIIVDFLSRIMRYIDTDLYSRLGHGFTIDADKGYAEIFCYIQLIIISLCFCFCYFRSRSPSYLCLFIIVVIIFLDDSLQIHENLGGYISDDWIDGIMMPASDFGDMIVFGVIGFFLVSLLVVGLAISDLKRRAIAALFLVMLILLGFFAVGMDVLHSIIIKMNINYGTGYLFTIIEDGGEMIVISLICSTALTTLTKLEVIP
jgi:hypothetical protein